MLTFSSGYKERSLCSEDLVAVYRNLNNGLFSVKALSGHYKGLVVGHFSSIRLLRSGKALTRLSVAGQKRARESRTRNVHCFVIGVVTEVELASFENDGYDEITYNPFIHDNFVKKDDMTVWLPDSYDEIVLFQGKCYSK